MSLLARAVSVALASMCCAASAHAATYVVSAHQTKFDHKLAAKVEAAGGTITARLPQIGVVIVESGHPDFATRAGKLQGVRSAVADVTVQFEQPDPQQRLSADFANPPNSSDDDRFFDLQWGHAAIDAAGAWNAGYRGEGATVAVLDSGLYCDHLEFADNLLAADSASFVPGEDYCNTGGSSHGTHTAGTILAGDNGAGTIGVAPEAKLIAVKVLSEINGSGSFGGIIQGIVHAADHGADVINMSLGVRGGLPVGGSEVAELINATKRAVQYAGSQNALVVASAGNDGRDLDHDSGIEICDDDGSCYRANLRAFPAQLPGVVTVSALGPTGWAYDFDTNLDTLASYSNYGQSAIDFGAPGGDFVYPGTEACTVKGVTVPCWAFDMVMSSTTSSGGDSFYGWSAGTSMAAPHVSGVAALIVGKHGGEMSPKAVERILRQSADDLGKNGNDDAYGTGRVNAARAVAD
ncbi:S8 family peptidase [Novilysobacter erysipheiresistens]|uniref:S8 family serine peptidase n=1 Tax=Novilysobacter erysipheiresistens TaxID=1749332 RepID=A0ABU7YZJ6_9GAMM